MPSSRAASASAPGPMKAAASTPPASASSPPAASAASIPGSMAATLSPPLGKGHPCPASPPRPPPEDRGCERLHATSHTSEEILAELQGMRQDNTALVHEIKRLQENQIRYS